MKQLTRNSNDHAWQSGRLMPALDTSHFVPDERGFEELVDRAIGYSRLLTYYDSENRAHPPPQAPETVGAWEAFFRDDVTFFLAEMAAVDAGREYRASRQKNFDTLEEIAKTGHRLVIWTQRAEHLAALSAPDGIEVAVNETLQLAQKNELERSLPVAIADQLPRQYSKLPKNWSSISGSQPPAEVFSTLNRVTGQLAAKARFFLTRSLTEKQNHPPHTALFLSFLTLLQKSQVDLNQMTERHLRFYYNQTLKLFPAPVSPDRAYVTFELAQQAEPCILEKGTSLIAGSGAKPDTPIFRTLENIKITSSKVASFKAISVRRSHASLELPQVKSITTWDVANSKNGLGEPLEKPKLGWHPFGAEKAMPLDQPLNIGIAITAPILQMSGGDRRVTMTLSFRPDDQHTIAEAVSAYRTQLSSIHSDGRLGEKLFSEHLSSAFLVQLSTATGYFDASDVVLDASEATDDQLSVRFLVPASAPPILPPDAGVENPFVMLRLNPKARVLAYTAFKDVNLSGVSIAVEVKGLRNLEISNALGPVDPTKPFPPFGPLPIPGGALYFKAPELSQPGVECVKLTVDWEGLPRAPADFKTHYTGYAPEVTNNSFTFSLARSDGQIWNTMPIGTDETTSRSYDFPLFRNLGHNKGIATHSEWNVKCNSKGAMPQRDGVEAARALGAGALRVELTGPEHGFGQTSYPRIVAQVSTQNAQNAQKLLAKLLPKNAQIPLPKEPILPLISGVSIEYSAKASRANKSDANAIHVYDLHALGKMTPAFGSRFLADDFEFDGRLMIGLDDVNPPEVVSLFFDLDDSVAPTWSKNDGFPRPKWRWSYLAGDRWRALPDEAILLDETNGLSGHGIIRIALPRDIAKSEDALSPALFWISITVEGDVRRYGNIHNVTAQAVRAERDVSQINAQLAPQLPANALKRLEIANPQIAKIKQPRPSSGGRAAEDDTKFRTRVSERLRHKDRAIQPEDFADIVLEEFPEISDVRCLRNSAGPVTLVVTGRRDLGHGARAILVPLKRRFEIAQWLKVRSSPWAVGLNVRNPSYETIKVSARIVASQGETTGVVRGIRETVDRIIAPWLFDMDAPMQIGNGVLDLADLGARLQDVSSVKKVTGLSATHVFETQPAFGGTSRYGLKDTARAVSTGERHVDHAILRHALPWSCFIPATQHDISYLGQRDGIGDLTMERDFVVTHPKLVKTYQDDGDLIPMRAKKAGIGTLRLGEDFVITKESDATPPTRIFDVALSSVDRVFLKHSGLELK